MPSAPGMITWTPQRAQSALPPTPPAPRPGAPRARTSGCGAGTARDAHGARTWSTSWALKMAWWGASRLRVSFEGMPWLALGASSATDPDGSPVNHACVHRACSTPWLHTAPPRAEPRHRALRSHAADLPPARWPPVRYGCTAALHESATRRDGCVRPAPPPLQRTGPAGRAAARRPTAGLTGKRATLRGREPRRGAHRGAPRNGAQPARKHDQALRCPVQMFSRLQWQMVRRKKKRLASSMSILQSAVCGLIWCAPEGNSS